MILLLLPWEVTLVPNFFITRWLGLLETPWAVWLPAAFSPLPVYLLSQYFQRLPPELREAAELDGAGEWQVFIRVSLPNIRTTLGAVTFLSFIDLWNMVELPRTLLRKESLMPLSVTLASIQPGTLLGPVFVASLMYLLPPLVIIHLCINSRLQRW
jgi:multiple sugar transport system permease protein